MKRKATDEYERSSSSQRIRGAATAKGQSDAERKAPGRASEHWNGSSWSVVPVPNPGKVAQLYGASTANGTTWAVGSYSQKRMTQGYMENPFTLAILHR